MARIYNPTREDEEAWATWVSERPPSVRKVAERFDMWSLYRMKSTGHRVMVYSFSEGDPVTLTVDVLGDFNLVAFERRVFGIDPDDLEPCDAPQPGEPVGSVMTQDDVADNIDGLRVAVRPDLWAMGDDGKAKRKQ